MDNEILEEIKTFLLQLTFLYCPNNLKRVRDKASELRRKIHDNEDELFGFPERNCEGCPYEGTPW